MIMHISKKDEIEDRRRIVSAMHARSKTEQEIADKLGKDRATISRDIKAIREERQQFIYDLAKSDLAFYYTQCMNTLTEVEREAWAAHDRSKNLKDRLQIWKVIIAAAQAKFPMFKDGPVFMTVKALEDRLANIEFGKKNQGLSK